MWPRGDELTVACEPSGSDIPVTALPAIAQDLVESVLSVEDPWPRESQSHVKSVVPNIFWLKWKTYTCVGSSVSCRRGSHGRTLGTAVSACW